MKKYSYNILSILIENILIGEKMKITFLGSGSAFVFSEENFQSSVLIEKNGKKLLIDAGTMIPEMLKHYNIDPTEIDAIYLTHNHADHNGGLEYLAFKTFFSTFPFGQKKIRLIGSPQVLLECWEHSLKAGLRLINGKEMTLADYFEVDTNTIFCFEDTKFISVRTKHVLTDEDSMPSYGLFFTENEQNIFFSGDMQFDNSETILEIMHNSDIIFHDCEIANYPGSVHAQLHQLQTLPAEIKSKKWLYHYTVPQSGLPDVSDFKGFVTRGQSFEI